MADTEEKGCPTNGETIRKPGVAKPQGNGTPPKGGINR